MINTYGLSNYTKRNFQSIHNNEFNNKRVKKFNMMGYDYTSYNLNENHQTILKKSLDILDMEGLVDYDPNKFFIDFHQRNCSESEKEKHSWSVWHKDDYSTLNEKVYTILFYIRKDKTVKGGELLIKNSLSTVFKTKYDTIKIEEGDILLFKGDLLHKPTPTWGFGCRDLIGVFIKRKKSL